MADMGWSKQIAQEDASNEMACIYAAEKSGHTKLEAELCENGNLGCIKCPFVIIYK